MENSSQKNKSKKNKNPINSTPIKSNETSNSSKTPSNITSNVTPNAFATSAKMIAPDPTEIPHPYFGDNFQDGETDED